MSNEKKRMIVLGSLLVAALLLFAVWNSWFSATKIGFINYQAITLGEISKANDNPFIRLAEIGTDELDKLDGCDMVFINAMGIRITEEQRALIQKPLTEGFPSSRQRSPTLLTTSARSTPPPPPCVPIWLAAEGATTAACWNMCAARWTAS